ncbi:MAG: M56 family metallopeptidase, partial [Planctomycetota bacterium]
MIVLPAHVDEWPEQRKRLVLLHELGHVKRCDCLWQLIAQLARTLHWFNPLVWLAGRRLRIERERAADDLVLTAGAKASDYAGLLLDIVRSLRPPALGTLAAVAMARKSSFESRLLAILDATRRRRGPGRMAGAAAVAVGLCALLPLATLRPGARAATADKVGEYRGITLRLHSSDPKIPFEKYVEEIAQTGANTICLSTAAYQENCSSSSLFIESRKAPTKARTIRLIQLARARGLRVVVMPIMLLENPRGGEWRGKIDPPKPDDWW